MTNALVSIIVPVVRETERLVQAFDSLLIQSHPAVEILVVAAVAVEHVVRGSLLQHHKRFRLLTLPDGALQADALALGLKESRGKYVGWLSPDDRCDPRRIEAQLAALSGAGGHAVACCSTHSISPTDSVLGINPLGEIGQSALWPLLSGGIDPASLLIPRAALDAVGGLDSQFPLTHELDLAVRLASRFPFRAVNTPLLRRRVPSASDPAHDPDAMTLELERVWSQVLDPANPWTVGAQASFSLAPLGRAWRCLHDRPIHAVEAMLRVLVGKRIGATDLAIGLLMAPNHAIADGRSVATRLGVPNATTIAIRASKGDPATAMAVLLETTRASRLVLIDPSNTTAGRLLIDQLLHMEAFDLDACPPFEDPLVFQPKEVTSVIPGCIFRRPALQAVGAEMARGDARFWTAFRRFGRVAALPARTPPRLRSSETNGTGLDGLVDSSWYRRRYPDIAKTGNYPHLHYRTHGWRETRDPNPWFSTAYYIQISPECLSSDQNPLDHFINVGASQGRRPSPAFDIVWYSQRYLGSNTPSAQALHHFLTKGIADGLVPDPSFDKPEILRALHALPIGERSDFLLRLFIERQVDKRLLTALVDIDWYRATYPDVAEAKVDPVAHYLIDGWKEQRDPNPWFSTAHYLADNLDVAQAGICPLTHFVGWGAAEQRSPCPGFDLGWYARRQLAGASPSAEALLHFLTVGLTAGVVPSPSLDQPSVRTALLAQPTAQRVILMKRILRFEVETRRGPLPWSEDNADLWPLWLRRGAPDDAMPVLLLFNGNSPQSRSTAQASSRVLPRAEVPLFLADQGDGTAHIGSFVGGLEGILELRLPDQVAALRRLAADLLCRRAASVDGANPGNPIQRAIFEAKLPLFFNGIDRNAPED